MLVLFENDIILNKDGENIMNTKNDDQLMEALELYLKDNTYNYAVMIDGPWGCGKSYFLEKKFIPKLKEDKRKYVYISFYGMNSLTELNKQIYLQNYLGNDEVELKSKLFGFGSSLVFDLMELKGIDAEKINTVKDLVKSKIPIQKDTVLIFDDLERSLISANELLGFINGFVEHQHLKTIVICNEQELKDSVDNIELKYLIAAKDTISFTKTISDSELFSGFGRYTTLETAKTDASNKLISIDELKNRVNKLFNEKTGYKKIKEKVIGNTFYYSCDLESACKSILDSLKINEYLNYKEIEDFVNLLETYLSKLCDILIRNKHTNLRTFQFYLSKMIQFYYVLIETNNQHANTIFEENIQFALQESIRYKLGIQNLDKLNLVQEDVVNYIAGKTTMSLNFVNDLIKKYELLKSEDTISQNLITIYNWCDYNTKKINDAFDELKSNYSQIDHVHYKRLLTTLAMIEHLGIIDVTRIDVFLESINGVLHSQENAKNILYELKHTVLELQNEKEIYQRYINKLSYPNNIDIVNPLQMWMDDQFSCTSVQNSLSVYDCVYLDNEIVDKIIQKIRATDNGLTIWNLYSIFDCLFIENRGIWNNSINIEENLHSIDYLIEHINQYITNNKTIDRVIWYALKKLVMRLEHIKEINKIK